MMCFNSFQMESFRDFWQWFTTDERVWCELVPSSSTLSYWSSELTITRSRRKESQTSIFSLCDSVHASERGFIEGNTTAVHAFEVKYHEWHSTDYLQLFIDHHRTFLLYRGEVCFVPELPEEHPRWEFHTLRFQAFSSRVPSSRASCTIWSTTILTPTTRRNQSYILLERLLTYREAMDPITNCISWTENSSPWLLSIFSLIVCLVFTSCTMIPGRGSH